MEDQEIKNEDRNFIENKQGGIDCERFIPSINDYAPYTMTAEEVQEVDPALVTPLSQEEKDAYVQSVDSEAALRYLASTDWYVVRMQETGKAVPTEVATAREEARAKVIS